MGEEKGKILHLMKKKTANSWEGKRGGDGVPYERGGPEKPTKSRRNRGGGKGSTGGGRKEEGGGRGGGWGGGGEKRRVLF